MEISVCLGVAAVSVDFRVSSCSLRFHVFELRVLLHGQVQEPSEACCDMGTGILWISRRYIQTNPVVVGQFTDMIPSIERRGRSWGALVE